VTLSSPEVRLPVGSENPLRRLGVRVALASALLVFVTLVAYTGRSGYRDAAGGEIGLLDCLYYATVSITTTGYGDIIPVTDGARLATTVLVTPARIVFLIILVGTTVEALASGTRTALRERIWRRALKDHTIVCGFGTKGRAAIETLMAQGLERDRIVVIDASPDAVEEATRSGFAAIHGAAGRVSVLEAADIGSAASVLVATDRDDSAVLVTLTARELNPGATIVAAAREAENVHLLQQSGADSVILSSAAAGRLLGQAVNRPQVVEVLEDLLSVGSGLDIIERVVGTEEAGRTIRDLPEGDRVVAVVRDGELLRFDDPSVEGLRDGDRLVCLRSTG
jgi:voltage-gated potassium channel